MAKLPDWVIEARDKASDLDGYASYAEDKKACADYDFRRAMLWEEHGTDLIRKIEQQAETIERLEESLGAIIEHWNDGSTSQLEASDSWRGTMRELIEAADVLPGKDGD